MPKPKNYVSEKLSEHYGCYIPVTDPNLITLLYLYALIRTGMWQSCITYVLVNS